jgi:hypothetical protein
LPPAFDGLIPFTRAFGRSFPAAQFRLTAKKITQKEQTIEDLE